MLDAVDRLVQRYLVRLMSDAIYNGVVGDPSRTEDWSRRAHRAAEIAETVYGPVVAVALLDQARADADGRATSFFASSLA